MTNEKNTHIKAALITAGGVILAAFIAGIFGLVKSSHDFSPGSTPTPGVTPAPTATALMSTSTPDDLYKNLTTKKPTWTDPLTGQNSNKWDMNSKCAFNNGAYQISALPSDTSEQHQCFAAGIPSLSDLAIQVDMTVTSGNSGGLIFRATSPGSYSNAYQIGLDIHAYYFFHLTHFQQCHLLPSSSDGRYCRTPDALQGLGATNTITIIAKGADVYFYINDGKFVDAAHSDALRAGFIGFFALCPQSNHCISTQVAFSNLKIWKL